MKITIAQPTLQARDACKSFILLHDRQYIVSVSHVRYQVTNSRVEFMHLRETFTYTLAMACNCPTLQHNTRHTREEKRETSIGLVGSNVSNGRGREQETARLRKTRGDRELSRQPALSIRFIVVPHGTDVICSN